MSEAAADHGFNPRLIAAVVAIGVVAFVALWALIALAPQISSGNDGGGHALSKAAPGYAGIVDLAERAGARVELRRSVETTNYEDHGPLLVLTPTHRTRATEIAELIDADGSAPVLLVLPKWQTVAVPGQTPKPGWVSGGLAVRPPAKMLPSAHFGKIEIKAAPGKAQSVPANITGHLFTAMLPGHVQTVSGENLETLIAAPGGGAVLAQVGGRDLYILADPDLINNLAFASSERARAAVTLVDAIAEYADADALAFDVTLNGFGSQRSLLRFAFVPPFIGITLCLIAAGLLALWQAWTRFGPALRPGRRRGGEERLARAAGPLPYPHAALPARPPGPERAHPRRLPERIASGHHLSDGAAHDLDQSECARVRRVPEDSGRQAFLREAGLHCIEVASAASLPARSRDRPCFSAA